MTETVPDRVLNFGSDTEKEDSQITPENVEAHADRLPVPTGYRILILPHEPKATTKGGIMLAKQTLEKERIAAIVGLVVSVGPSAYADKEKFPDGPWCKEGDWIIITKYAGSRIKIDGGELRIINDDEVLAVVDDPRDILPPNLI